MSQAIRELRDTITQTQTKMGEIGAELTKIAEGRSDLVTRTEKNNEAIKVSGEKMNELADQFHTLQEQTKRLTEVVKVLEKGGSAPGSEKIEDAISTFMASKTFTTWRDEMKAIHRPMRTKSLKGSFFGALTMRQAMYRKAMLHQLAMMKGNGAGVFSNTENPGLVNPYYRPDIVNIPRPILRLRQLFPVMQIPVATNAINIDRQTIQWDWAQKILAAVVATATTAQVERTTGLGTAAPYNSITFDDGTNSETVTITNIDPDGTITFAPALANPYAAGTFIRAEYFKCTPESTIKPTSRHRTEQTSYNVYKLTTTQKVSTEMLEDDMRAEQWLRNEMLAAIEQNAEKAMLYGSGNNCHLGIFEDSDVPRYDLSGGLSGANKIDHLIDVAFEVILQHYDPTNAVVNPIDLKDMFRAKDQEGGYLFLRNMDQMLPTQLISMALTWSTLLGIDRATNVGGDFFLGELGRAATIFDRSDSMIQIGTSGDDFEENLRTLLAEQRFAFPIYSPLAMAKGTFDSVVP